MEDISAGLKPPNTTNKSAVPPSIKAKARKKNTSKSGGRKKNITNEISVEITSNNNDSILKDSGHFTGMKKFANIVRTKLFKHHTRHEIA